MGGSSGSENQGEGHNSTMEYPPSLYIGIHVVGIPLGAAIIVGNILLMVVLKLSHTKQQRSFTSKTAVILGNISCCDALGGLVLVVNVGLYSLYDVIGIASPVGCYLWNIVCVVPLLGSFLLLTCMAIERYMIVNEIPHYPHMQRLKICIAVVWIYTIIVCILALAFLNREGQDAYLVCDILTISALYMTVIVFAHVMICIMLCTALICVIRNAVKHHQCKIQVSNTITYNNLMDDAQVARLFFVITMTTLICWLPFLVCEILIVAGLQSRDLLTTTRWTFLFGHFGYLKCFWLMIGCRPLWQDYKKTFSKPKKRPFRMGTIVRDR